MAGDSYFTKGGLTYTGYETKRTGCSCFSLIGFVVIVLLILLGLVIGLFYASDYNAWKDTFLLEANPNYLVEMEDIEDRERTEIKRKIDAFNGSQQTVDFVEFTPREVAIILGESVEDALPTGVVLDMVYVEPYERKWRIYFKTSAGDITFPWLGVELIKDDFQTAVLNINAVYLGADDLGSYGLGFIAQNLNDGYKDALDLVNQSNITGRELENIELDRDMLIIKGRDSNGDNGYDNPI